MAQHHYAVLAQRFLFACKRSAQIGGNPQQWKQTRRNAQPWNALGFGPAGEVVAFAGGVK